MLGHATLLIELDGKTILTDPWLTEPLYFGQLTHPGDFTPPESLPPIDLVLISHGHQDHCDPNTLSMLPSDTPVIICKSYRKTAEKAGCERIHPMAAGDTFLMDTLVVQAMPGKHPGGITTYMLQGREGKVFFGGDSAYTPALEEALRDTWPDVCLMPISGGSVGPLVFHMNAREAATLVAASGAKASIPIHYHFQLKWGGLKRFLMGPECLEDFQEAMKEKAPKTAVSVLDYNETWEK